MTFNKDLPAYDLDAFAPLEVPSGALVLLHGALVHFSYENTSPHSRHAYSMHVVEGGPGHSYARENWCASVLHAMIECNTSIQLPGLMKMRLRHHQEHHQGHQGPQNNP